MKQLAIEDDNKNNYDIIVRSGSVRGISRESAMKFLEPETPTKNKVISFLDSDTPKKPKRPKSPKRGKKGRFYLCGSSIY